MPGVCNLQLHILHLQGSERRPVVLYVDHHAHLSQCRPGHEKGNFSIHDGHLQAHLLGAKLKTQHHSVGSHGHLGGPEAKGLVAVEEQRFTPALARLGQVEVDPASSCHRPGTGRISDSEQSRGSRFGDLPSDIHNVARKTRLHGARRGSR